MAELSGAVTFTADEIATFPQGPEGDQGDNGTRWYVGSGLPSDTVGADGDLYLSGATGDIYQKEAGTWA